MSASRAKSAARKAKVDTYRRLLTESAERVFAEYGFDDAKIQDIAQGAGLSLGTMYSVFTSKSEIYDAIQDARGGEIFHEIQAALPGPGGIFEASMRGIEAYVRCLIARPHYLKMHLREGLSWSARGSLRTGEQAAVWERGAQLAIGLLTQGIERGFFHADNPPDVLLRMMVAAHQVQIQDWLDRGAEQTEIPSLVLRMQEHFHRAFVRSPR